MWIVSHPLVLEAFVRRRSFPLSDVGTGVVRDAAGRRPFERNAFAYPRPARVYRLRFNTPDPLLLINCTVWLAPCTTMWITPEIEYSLL